MTQKKRSNATLFLFILYNLSAVTYSSVRKIRKMPLNNLQI